MQEKGDKMIVLNVTYKCKLSKRAEYLHAIHKEGIDVSSQAEEGCLKYEYYNSTTDDDELLLIEKWKDSEAIDVHKNTEHFKRLGELKAEYVIETTIEKFITEE